MFKAWGFAGLLVLCCLFAAPSAANAGQCRYSSICGDYYGLNKCCTQNIIYYKGKVAAQYSSFSPFCSTLQRISKLPLSQRKWYGARQYNCRYN